MNYYLGLPLFLTVALLQVGAMPSFSPLGVTPNILLVLVASWAALRGPAQALPLMLAAAIFHDLLTADPMGISIIALTPLLLLAGGREGRPAGAPLGTALLAVAVGTLAYHLLDGAVRAALGQGVPWTAALTQRWLPAMAVNTVLTPAFYLPLWWASFDLRRPAAPIRWRT